MPEAPVSVEAVNRGDLASYYSANATLETKCTDHIARRFPQQHAILRVRKILRAFRIRADSVA